MYLGVKRSIAMKESCKCEYHYSGWGSGSFEHQDADNIDWYTKYIKKFDPYLIPKKAKQNKTILLHLTAKIKIAITNSIQSRGLWQRQ